MQSDRLQHACHAWSDLIGSERVLNADQAQARYGYSTIGVKRWIAGALKPDSGRLVPEIVRIASLHGQALYPLSTGHNWGYGAAVPVVDGCVILDLSDLKGIECLDPDLGVFRLEPGVTQGALYEYLEQQNLPFMVPTTGAGPDASLVGNALERGFGITPIADHFGAVMRIEAVLPNGSLYRSALTDWGAAEVDHLFKWGVGPYVDGLFTQGNLGVVTAMSIALARRPEKVQAFYFRVAHEEQLQAAVVAVRTILQTLPGVAGGINLMNRRRVLSVVADRSTIRMDGPVMSDALVQRLSRKHRVSAWMGMGALYGNPTMVTAAARLVRQYLASLGRVTFMTPAKATGLANYAERLLGPQRGVSMTLRRIESSLNILLGIPSRVALPLAYWRKGLTDQDQLDPALDGCDLLWYAPLVPMKPERAQLFVDEATRICLAHGMEPFITLSALSERCFGSTVPLLFDSRQPEEVERAHGCYDALLQAGLAIGMAPYRLHVGAMSKVTHQDSTYWKLVQDIKTVVDPHGTVSPGRYAPVREHD